MVPLVVACHKAALSNIILLNRVDNRPIFTMDKLFNFVDIKRLESIEKITEASDTCLICFIAGLCRTDNIIQQFQQIGLLLNALCRNKQKLQFFCCFVNEYVLHIHDQIMQMEIIRAELLDRHNDILQNE